MSAILVALGVGVVMAGLLWQKPMRLTRGLRVCVNGFAGDPGLLNLYLPDLRGRDFKKIAIDKDEICPLAWLE